MANSRRWREFIRWWYDMRPKFGKDKRNTHIISCINHQIDWIKSGKAFKDTK